MRTVACPARLIGMDVDEVDSGTGETSETYCCTLCDVLVSSGMR